MKLYPYISGLLPGVAAIVATPMPVEEVCKNDLAKRLRAILQEARSDVKNSYHPKNEATVLEHALLALAHFEEKLEEMDLL